MFIPLHDANSLKYIKLQYVTLSLIVVNVLVFLLMSVSGDYAKAASIGLGYIPAVVHDHGDPARKLRFRPARFHLHHLRLPACRHLPSRRQHAVPLGVSATMSKTRSGTSQVPDLLSPLRRCGSVPAWRDPARFRGAAHRRVRGDCRHRLRLSAAASARKGLGACVSGAYPCASRRSIRSCCGS